MAQIIKIGDKYNLLTVRDIQNINGRTVYVCQCDCGRRKDVIGQYKLLTGAIKSCGCLKSTRCAERNRAGRKFSEFEYRIREIWRQMHQRCENPYHISYKYYGGKSVKVCEEWRDYQKFVDWSLKNGYRDTLSLDRVDSTRGYSPNNCRWVSYDVQNNNSSHCHYLTFNGQTKSMSEWSKETGISYSAIKSRLNKLHWSIEKTLTIPSRNTKS